MGMVSLEGCRVLVVEDEYFLADDLKKGLEARGAKVVGPIADLGAAQDRVSHDDFDVALIDLKLSDEFAWSLADELMREEIPFAFVTGYGADRIPTRFRSIRRWEKPCDVARLAEDIRLLCDGSRKTH
jgi:DNA-binding response OmpR family regulator